MKKSIVDNIKALLIVMILILAARQVGFLPWWGFVIPLLPTGMFLAYKKWKVAFFGIGFLGGFLIWIGGNLYFEYIGNGIVLNRIAQLLAISKAILVVASGFMGGLLGGLSLFVGANVINTSKPTIFSETVFHTNNIQR